MKYRLRPSVLAFAFLGLSLGVAAESATPPEKRVTLTGPGWSVTIDLAQFVDPSNPGDDTVAQVIGGLIQGKHHGELLAFVLARPERHAAFDALTTRFSQLVKKAGSSEPDPTDLQRLTGSDRNDVLFVGHSDPQKSIKGGAGHNIGIVVGDKSVTLNLAQAQLTAALGGPGNDILIGGGRSSVMIDGGSGGDILIGGVANDMLSGGDGADLIDGGAGNDILRGGAGSDQLMGGAGDDHLYGGLGDDRLAGGAGNDLLSGDDGDDTLDGGEGIDMAWYRGPLSDYRIFRIDGRTWRVADSRFGRDGSDTLREIERLNFADWWAVPLDHATPIPVGDTVVVRYQVDSLAAYRGRPLTNAYLLRGGRLTANDLSLSGKEISLRALIDDRGREVLPETWATVNGGQALLTSSGNVIYQRTGTFGPMSFRYRIADASGSRGAIATRAGNSTAAEMWAAVQLVGSEPVVVPTQHRRECSESCTLDSGETELLLTDKASINGTGNDLPNTLIGNANDNVLDGGRGADIMRGGPGDDTYFVDDPGDRAIEMPHEGIDTVWSTIEGYTLPANVENLVLLLGVRTGRGNELDNHLRGSDIDNVLEGGPGNDMLDGGKGADRMIGGPGDDTYIVDNPGDQVVAEAGEGTDTVIAEISYILPTHVENLVLTGRGDINGTGNDLDNRLIGNAGNNSLYGGPGNDWLDGGPGDDTLYGGAGNDTYFGSGGRDIIIEDDPMPNKVNTLVFAAFFKRESLWFWRQDDDLNIGLMNGKDWVTIRHWYRGPAHRIEQVRVGDSALGPEGAETLVTTMHDLAPAAGGKGVPVDEIKRKLGPLLEEVWRKETKPIPAQSSWKPGRNQLQRQSP